MIPLRLTAAAPKTDAAVQKKIQVSSCPSNLVQQTTKLIVSNKKVEDIMKEVKYLEESGLLIQDAR